MKLNVRREPVMVTGVAAALVQLAVALGFDLSAELQAALTGVIILAANLFARQQVTPVEPGA